MTANAESAAPPAAPAPAGWVMVPRGLLRRLIAEALTFDPSLQDKEAIEQAKQLAASPAAPVVREPLTDERITKALRRAFSLGQTYWQQADSDSYTQNAKSDETRQKFETLIAETLNGITGASK